VAGMAAVALAIPAVLAWWPAHGWVGGFIHQPWYGHWGGQPLDNLDSQEVSFAICGALIWGAGLLWIYWERRMK
jgi:hypothetical protein